MADVEVVKTSGTTLSGPTASCFSSGGGQGAVYRMYKMRADVRKLLPLEVGGNGKSTGKRLVNNQDLQQNRNAAGTYTPCHSTNSRRLNDLGISFRRPRAPRWS